MFRSSKSEVSSSQRHIGSCERHRYGGRSSTCDTNTQSHTQSDSYPMSQPVLYDQLIQLPFAFQQILPCIYEASRQEMNLVGDLIFDFNFNHYQALSQ